jgi:DEAD/DEAH box helicase domain-containing protein
VSRLGFSNAALRQHLMETFATGYGERGCFLADPVFEATFGWETAEQTMQELAPGLLHPDLVRAMDAPPGGDGSDYRFPATGKPYVHQLAAWRHLLASERQSVVVTSGTGSGKTECFMVPILSELARQREEQGRLEGIRALFLYPLNALIQSQRERLRAWTAAFGDEVRFCLFNGMTPDKSRQDERQKSPNEVIDREVLRASPPPLLVTNPTMLEYMLVRAQDAPIIDKSQGMLEWVVLDEAHNYVGSQAAELALLLRRVMHAFGSDADRVRFIATSATIGSDKELATEQLRHYLAKLAGVSPDRVQVVQGTRRVPTLTEPIRSMPEFNLEEHERVQSPADRYVRLSADPVARRLRALFEPSSGSEPFQQLSAVGNALSTTVHQPAGRKGDGLRWLDLLTSAKFGDGREAMPFLPLRLHVFHNTLSGIWACADSRCSARTGTALAAAEWPYGKVFTEERRHCDCGALVFELTSCNDCNSTFLRADLLSSSVGARLAKPKPREEDEFTLDVEPGDEDDDAAAVENLEASSSVLIANGSLTHTTSVLVDRSTGQIDPKDATTAFNVRLRDLEPRDGETVLPCPDCGGHRPRSERQFRKAILGAPFLLSEIIPTLLEFCPDGDAPNQRPLRGRRMITFTDSRQGTARIAAKLQQDAERNRVRGAIYQRVTSPQQSASAEATTLQQDIARLEAVMGTMGAGRVALEPIVTDKKNRLRQLQTERPIPFDEMSRWLVASDDVGLWMHDYYASIAPGDFKDSRGKERLADIMLMREFARRPKRVNSLETMGLVSVQYPKLDTIKSLPAAAASAPLGIEEWKDFLKLALDFHVRENTFIDLSDTWQKWGGNRITAKRLLGPKSIEQTTNRLKKWPRCVPGRQPRLARILAYVLRLDPETAYGRDLIDSLLDAAWDDLAQRAGLLQMGDRGRFLAMADISLSVIRRGWICPVTRRILDTTLRSVTPYLPSRGAHEGVAKCREIEMPICSLLNTDFPSAEERTLAIREWVNAQPGIEQMRRDGLWSDLSDRIVEGGAFFRAVEHSAQQPGSRLQEYEALFRSGRVNLMSCSTTMEMGVDIGGINMVAMNNVPPHPANYLQRAGRAGRRAETRSVALTVCKNNPHDQEVFTNTLWPFTTRLPAPVISLSSALLVQRHLNALILSAHLRRLNKSGGLTKLTMEWWMLPRGASRQEGFVAWCECFDAAKELALSIGMRSLLRQTVFEGQTNLAVFAREVAACAVLHAARWMDELNAIDEQMEGFSGADKVKEREPAYNALRFQRRRLTDEYLLRELASGGFLPGYGFPTDITSFDTLNVDALLAMPRGGKSGREDNRHQRRELPSRDSMTALREYAPGATVVLDGLVYESDGITLNWHAPASLSEVAEIQNIRAAWRCRGCGASGTVVLAADRSFCPECGSPMPASSATRLQYLEPAGFAVDLYKATHNDISQQTYVPVETPWINADGDWIALPNAARGRFRATPQGSVFHCSSGINGTGYALCLDCGRAAPMGSEEAGYEIALPSVFRHSHRRLRGAQGGETKECAGSGNPFSLRKGLRFGREYTTDVLEVILYASNGKPLTNHTAAFSIAVALRRVIASSLGVEESELGCDTKETRAPSGERVRALQIFDHQAAGYSSSVAARLPELLGQVRAALVCDHNCDSACQHCLLTFDTRYRVDSLDRHQALEFMDSEWVEGLSLPPSEAHFGPTASECEYQPLDEALTRELNRADTKALALYVATPPEDWDLAGSPLRRLLHRWTSEKSTQVSLVVRPGLLAQAPDDAIRVLTLMQELCQIETTEGTAPACANGAHVVATVTAENGDFRSWATRDGAVAEPSASWGCASDAPLVCGPSGPPKIVGKARLTYRSSPSSIVGATPFAITTELDGDVKGFGTRLLSMLIDKMPGRALPGTSNVVSVTYEDRYLRSPLPAMLLLEFVLALKGQCEAANRWAVTAVRLVTCRIDGGVGRRRSRWDATGDWSTDSEREGALIEGFRGVGGQVVVDVFDKRDTAHARKLHIGLLDGSGVTLWLDQGFSFWTLPRGGSQPSSGVGTNTFPFGQSALTQGAAIAAGHAKVLGYGHVSPMFLAVK